MFLNFHTHKALKPVNGKAIRNIIAGEAMAEPPSEEDWFSVGVHPWYFDEEDKDKRLLELMKMLDHPNAKLIGECGLDRLKGVTLELQQQVFEVQVSLADKLRKPVLIHCVKCYSELLAIKKRLQPTVPLIIHGFNSKLHLAGQLLNAGFYFSLGAAVLRDGSNAGKWVALIPENRLFLETDDSANSIEEVYSAVASIRKTSLNHLKDTIFANWLSLQSGGSL